MRNIYYAICFLLLAGCKVNKTANPHIAIQTQYGDIELELYPKQAPKTVAAFLGYIDSGFYFNSNFYRVLNLENQPTNAPKTELIQGGIWKTNHTKSCADTRNPPRKHTRNRDTPYRRRDFISQAGTRNRFNRILYLCWETIGTGLWRRERGRQTRICGFWESGEGAGYHSKNIQT